MTSYSPWTKYAARPDLWCGSKFYRFATSAEAQEVLDEAAQTRDDLIDTKIEPHAWQPTHRRIQGHDISLGGKKRP